MAARNGRVAAPARFEAVVLWASAHSNRLAVQDDTSAALLEMDLQKWALKPGDRILVEGACVAEQGRLFMRNAPLVDNDGAHPMSERSGSILLAPGNYPIRAEYFNAGALFGFRVDMEGGGLRRQPVPASALFRSEVSEREISVKLVPGLNYACYLGSWLMLPNFAALPPSSSGTTLNFDLNVRARDTNFALVFTGWIEISKAAEYTFTVSSDDGSRLWIADSPVNVTALGTAPIPSPKPIDLQSLAPGRLAWSSVEGIIHFIGREKDGSLVVKLDAGGREIQVEVDEAFGPTPAFMSRARVDGIAQIVGGKTRLFVPSAQNFQVIAPAAAKAATPGAPPPQVVSNLRKAESTRHPVTEPTQLEGVVLAASPGGESIILQDEAGVALIELGFARTPVAAGQRVRIDGPMTDDAGQWSAPGALLIDNDGVHGLREKSAGVRLKAGKHPISVGYFNALGGAVLDVYFQGPNLPKQKIPNSALFRWQTSPGETGRFVPGLEFAVYQDFDSSVPKFTQAAARTNGMAANFDIGPYRNETYFAMSFQGFVEVPRDGMYVFSLNSDDGSVLSLNVETPRVSVVGDASIPLPRPIAPRQILGGDQSEIWAAVEGTVSFASMRDDVLTLDLSSATGRMQVEVLHAANAAPMLLRGSRVRVVGVCQNSFGSDGQRVAASMRTPSLNQVAILTPASRLWTDYRVTSASTVARQGAGDSETIAHIAGRNRGRVGDGLIAIEDQSGTIWVDSALLSVDPQKPWIQVVGRVTRAGTNTILSGAIGRPLTGDEDLEALRLLTTIDEVKSLSRAEAARGYPAKVRGVITALMDEGFFIQDATRSIYVNWVASADADVARVGDYWEVEGATFIDFAPNIKASKASRIGIGTLPDPIRPTWDQLISGSLDTQFIEIEGVIISSEDGTVTLMTRSGQLLVNASEMNPKTFKDAENARVRLRGCYAPERDNEKQQIVIGKLTLYNPSMSVDEPAPGDSFQAPLKHSSDLLRFDTQAGALQRVKVRGQFLRERDGEYFLYDDPTGLRFTARGEKPRLKPGDLVELVGFPELERLSPKVRFANVRKVGHTNLPPATTLSDSNLLKSELDATLVKVEGQLLNVRISGPETVLEMQTGARVFLARLAGHGDFAAQLPIGARLQLTGVYAGHAGEHDENREMDAFEVLLNAPADIAVLESPSWWNIRHTAAVVASLSFVLLAAAAWIKSLRRRVDQRTRELLSEVEVRRKAEVEAVRAREIADAANSAKSQFLATMSHEIRTPMNGVLGMTNLLLETNLDPEQKDFAQTTRQCADSLLTIINDILDFSKVEAGKLEFECVDFDLIETIESTVEMLAERAHQKSVELILDIHRDTPRFVRGDAARLRQILMNLVGNGVKFTPKGEVLVEVKMAASDDKRARLCFTVRDTGIGMDEATREKLFKPFTQADASTTRKYGGTGLGLVISQRLLQIMGSHIEVESAPGVGSTFSFLAAFELAQKPAAPRSAPPALHGKRALVVEDNATAGAVLERHLTDFRMQVARADSALEALSLLRKAAEANEPFEIVIVDGQLAGMDGLALARAIHAERILAATRVIVAGSVCHRVTPPDLQASSVEAHLFKPLRSGQLLDALSKIGQALSQNTAQSPRDFQAAAPGASIAAPVRALKILLAEDNPVNQKVALRQLKKLGYEADTVMNGLEALEAVRKAPYEVILMDCQMPEMDGLEATRRLRAQGSTVWVIAMTANAMQGDREICLAAGMDDYITKPVRINDLEAALEVVASHSANVAAVR